MKDKIIVLLNSYRDSLLKEYEKHKKEILLPLDSFANRMMTVKSEPLKISEFDIKEIDNLFENIGIEIIEKLEMYKKLSKLSFFPLTKEQLVEISSIMNGLIIQLDKIKKDIIDSDEILKDFDDKIKSLENIILKVNALYNDTEYLSSIDIMKIVDILKETTVSIEEQIIIIQELSLMSLNRINTANKENEEEILFVEETGIEKETLEELFKEYGYDFNDFRDADKNKLLTYGRIGNIKEILEVLANNNLHIHIRSYSHKLAQIFINSDSYILSTIIENLQKDNEPNRTNSSRTIEEMFKEYLNTPSIFIRGKRAYKRKNPTTNGPGGSSGNISVIGAFDNYIKNRELLLEKGIDINSVVTKCKTLLTTPHQKVKENFACFDFYGIHQEAYSNALYSLTSVDPLSAIDQFIELGCYNYILSNFSYVTRKPDDLLFYRIVKANQLGETIYSDRNTQKIELSGKISNDRKYGYGINKENKEESVSQFTPTFNSMYDEVINSDRSTGPIILAYNNYFIQKIEEYKVDDLRYDFNGVIISRFKVLRIYETLIKNRIAGTYDAICYAICKNSILTEEQYRNIISCLNKVYGNNLRGATR